MNKQQITQLHSRFDGIVQTVSDEGEGVEFWYTRDLMTLLGYDRWENFAKAIERAVTACETSGGEVGNHFRDVTKMVPIGSGAERPVADVMLTRYACYLIAQTAILESKRSPLPRRILRCRPGSRNSSRNASGSTNASRLGSDWIALSKNLYERGVDDKGFGRIRSKGDSALFGGKSTQAMKNQLAVPGNRPLADFLPTVTIAAKHLANEMTNHNVTTKDLVGEDPITREHVQNNSSVRAMLENRGIQPESLPPAEDLKKLERRVKTAEKKMIRESELPGATSGCGTADSE